MQKDLQNDNEEDRKEKELQRTMVQRNSTSTGRDCMVEGKN